MSIWGKPAVVTCQPLRAATDPQVSRINARSLEFTPITQTEVGREIISNHPITKFVKLAHKKLDTRSLPKLFHCWEPEMAGGRVNNDQEVELCSAASLRGFQQKLLPQVATSAPLLLLQGHHLVRHTVQAAMLKV